MDDDSLRTNSQGQGPEFDFSRFPPNTLFHERRQRTDGPERDAEDAALDDDTSPASRPERRPRKERRRRIDPTTFEKQYSQDEMEFMKAMQRFKELSGTAFPSHGDVLRIAIALGYRRAVFEFDPLPDDFDFEAEPSIIIAAIRDN